MNASFGNKIIFLYYLLCVKQKLWSFECNIGRQSHVCIFFFSSCLPICPFNCNIFYACACKYHKCEYLLKIVTYSTSFLLCLRPIILSFTFLFRSFTYLMFVALPIRPEIMRNVLLAITILVYFIKYIHEIININAEILEHIFQVKESIEHTTGFTRESEIKSEIEYVEEKIVSAIYRQLLFIRNKPLFSVLLYGYYFRVPLFYDRCFQRYPTILNWIQCPRHCRVSTSSS